MTAPNHVKSTWDLLGKIREKNDTLTIISVSQLFVVKAGYIWCAFRHMIFFRCHLALYGDISMCTILFLNDQGRSGNRNAQKKNEQSMCTNWKGASNIPTTHWMTFKNKQIWNLSVFKCHREKKDITVPENIDTHIQLHVLVLLKFICWCCWTVNPCDRQQFSFAFICILDCFFPPPLTTSLNIGKLINMHIQHQPTHFKLPQFSC